jgi:hypothetical protein
LVEGALLGNAVDGGCGDICDTEIGLMEHEGC